MTQRTLLVRQRENYAAFISLSQRAQHVGLIWIAYHQETGKVMLIVLNVVFKNLQSVQLCCLSMTNGSPSALLSLSYHLSRTCSVLSFYILKLRMICQEVAALHQCHRVRVYLSNSIPIVLRQTTDAVSNVQLVLAYHRCAAVAQQLVVVKQATCYCILNSQHTYSCGILFYLLEHLFESATTNKLYLLSLEVKVCRYIVERPYQSLYCNSFHYLTI